MFKTQRSTEQHCGNKRSWYRENSALTELCAPGAHRKHGKHMIHASQGMQPATAYKTMGGR